jgi:glycosyltransferase involved in cell wall biosynthesis
MLAGISLSNDLVFLTPITPNANGPGLAMRADHLLRTLAEYFSVHLRVVPIQEAAPTAGAVSYDGPCASQECVWFPPSLLHRLRHLRGGELRRLSPAAGQGVLASLAGVSPKIIVTVRHCLAPIGRVLREAIAPKARLVLDLDEQESRTRDRLAELHRTRGEWRSAYLMRHQAAHYRMRERVDFSAFDDIWVSSQEGREQLLSDVGLDADVVPNVVALPELQGKGTDTRSVDEGYKLLFVGGLGYTPNLDGVEWFVHKVMPVLQDLLDEPVTLHVVGAHGVSLGRHLARTAGVQIHGYIESLASQYADAAVCIVPIRAGGGTRIKLLEALAHSRPVVSTSMGAEGLNLRPDVEILFADTPIEFARACERVLRDPEAAATIGRHGRKRVEQCYGPAAMKAAIEAIVG